MGWVTGLGIMLWLSSGHLMLSGPLARGWVRDKTVLGYGTWVGYHRDNCFAPLVAAHGVREGLLGLGQINPNL